VPHLNLLHFLTKLSSVQSASLTLEFTQGSILLLARGEKWSNQKIVLARLRGALGLASMRDIFETISLEQAPRAFLKEFSNLSERGCAHAAHTIPQECAAWAK